jgi:glucose/arabinose dehydrogenase
MDNKRIFFLCMIVGFFTACGIQGNSQTTTRTSANFVPSYQPKNTSVPGGKLAGNVKIKLVQVAAGFIDPINVVVPDDGTGRIFVVERAGVVKIIENGKVLKKPFMDIRHTVVSSFLEQGLYDLEFHPNFKRNGKFYIHYSDMWFNGDSFIAEYQVSKKDPNKFDPKSVRVLMKIAQPYANHNGGELVFGPDGYLYIGSGDGGWEGDVLNAGQRKDTLLAKVLRIDVNTRSAGKAYGIPKTNPFQTPLQQMVLFGVTEEEFAKIHPRAKPEIWAYGVRNPLKMSFDRKTGDLYIADVGQNQWEEINFQPAASKGGENYGWKFMCGTKVFPLNDKGQPVDPYAPRVGVMPVSEYSHSKDGLCVVCFGVSRSRMYPSLEGVYFFGDWGSGRVWGLKRDKNKKWVTEQLLDSTLRFTGAGEDPKSGQLYVTNCWNAYDGKTRPVDNKPGAVWKIVPADKVPAGAKLAPLDK